ncbi:MAG: 2-hydroxyacyl-CoA dehydratase [Pirellulaceae bacterium]|nr:2-hydroxyacyl-CoA dehydratase [Pirellulaceae bacterium]
MSDKAEKITLAQWDDRYRALCCGGLRESPHGGPLRRHVDEGGDRRLLHLRMDNSAAALRLWNLLLSEESRLRRAREQGVLLVGTMKDLGTVPVMAYALDNVIAFYPDGAWWTPCLMEHNEGLLALADRLGVDDSFCPVRAMLAAMVNGEHFPIPDTLVCSVGAVCDDMAAIGQRIDELGFPVFWWEIPHRRAPEPGEPSAELPGGLVVAQSQVDFVRDELDRVRRHLETVSGQTLDEARLAEGIRRANEVRRRIARLRRFAYLGDPCPLPALEMMIAEILAIHFCSDWAETVAVLDDLLAEVRRRLIAGDGVCPAGAARIFWVNPPADLRAMNLLEEAGARVCGTDYMIAHAIDEINLSPKGYKSVAQGNALGTGPEQHATPCKGKTNDIGPPPSLDLLARMALADPMVGPTTERARRICREAAQNGAEAVIVSRIPGASHCATEALVIGRLVHQQLGIPVLDLEIPPLLDPMEPTIRTRLEALVETVINRRQP